MKTVLLALSACDEEKRSGVRPPIVNERKSFKFTLLHSNKTSAKNQPNKNYVFLNFGKSMVFKHVNAQRCRIKQEAEKRKGTSIVVKIV